jgi:hypothetical protein
MPSHGTTEYLQSASLLPNFSSALSMSRFARVDRFPRRLSDLLDLLGELEDAGVAFVSATEPFDTSTSIGRMLVQLLGVFAELNAQPSSTASSTA